MKVKLLDKYEAEIASLFPQTKLPPWRKEDRIVVWLTFEEAVGSCLSFGVDIPAKDYNQEDFLAVVQAEADATLANIIKRNIEQREEARKRDDSRKALNKLTADLGEKLGLEFRIKER